MIYTEQDWLAVARDRTRAFFARVKKRGPFFCGPSGYTRCWAWTGATDLDGYGKFTVAATIDGKRKFHCFRAHRLSAQLSGVELFPEVHVLHQCDNPSCVNPNHFRYGDHDENMAEKASRGRAAKSLTPEAVREIRASKASVALLAIQHGVSTTTIREVIRRQTWDGVE